jgi:hypothetical protein
LLSYTQQKNAGSSNLHSYYLFIPLVKSKFNYAAAVINGIQPLDE